MKNFKTIIFFSSIGLAVLAQVFLAAPVKAAEINTAGVVYPIAELGSCKDQAACASYCDQSQNMLACVGYAEKNKMIDSAEAAVAKKAIAKIQSGQTPGGCSSKENCENYCQTNAADLNQCIAFAEEIGVPAAELEQAKKVALALQNGATLPGNCQGQKNCEAYCRGGENIDECLSFAEAAQILPADELAEAKKIAPYLKSGQTPGGCKSKADCQAFCDQEANFSTCINFAEQVGFVSSAEAELARKTGGKGPGGCKSKQACEDYCNQPENAKACGQFALEKGLVDEKTAERISGGYLEIAAGLEKMPAEARPDAENCLNSLFNGNLAAVLTGQQAITKIQGEKIGACFEDATKKFADEQMGAAAGAAASGEQTGQPAISPKAQKSLESAPPEIKNKIQQQIEEQKQKAIKEAQLKIKIPAAPPSGSLPADAGASRSAPPAVQGPPCSTPEECRAMFGGPVPAPQ